MTFHLPTQIKKLGLCESLAISLNTTFKLTKEKYKTLVNPATNPLSHVRLKQGIFLIEDLVN